MDNDGQPKDVSMVLAAQSPKIRFDRKNPRSIIADAHITHIAGHGFGPGDAQAGFITESGGHGFSKIPVHAWHFAATLMQVYRMNGVGGEVLQRYSDGDHTVFLAESRLSIGRFTDQIGRVGDREHTI